MTDINYLDLVRAAVLAPSPDNNQPWQFAAGDGCLLVYLDRDRTLPSDVRGMFDLMGLGAAIENACIAARQMGLQPTVTYTHDSPAGADDDCQQHTVANHLTHVASIRFEAGGQVDPLYAQLETRCTCRTPCSAKPLPQDQLDRISNAAAGFSTVQLDWITDRQRLRELANLVAATDQIRLQYEDFHNEVFRQLRFSAEEAERTRDGLDVRVLDLPPGVPHALKLLRPWSRMKWLHRLRLTGMLTAPLAAAMRKSGALGVITLPAPTATEFLNGGRALERAWLAADREGLAFQPLGSTPVFFGHVQILHGQRLSDRHRARIEVLIRRFDQLVSRAAGRALFMVFRLGIAPRPQVRSLRRPAEEVFLGHHADPPGK